MSAARRIVTLARILAGQRVRRETLLWLWSGFGLLTIPAGLRVAGLFQLAREPLGEAVLMVWLVCAISMAGLGPPGLLGRRDRAVLGHLPVSRPEFASAVSAAEVSCGFAGALAWLVLLAGASLVTWALTGGSLVVPAGVGGRLHAAPAAVLASVAGSARDIVVAAAIGAVPRALGRTRKGDEGGMASTATWWLPWVMVAVVWVLTGRAELALVASGVWLWVDPTGAPVDRDVDRNLVPRLKDVGPPRVRSVVNAAIAIVGTELAIRVVPAIVSELLPHFGHMTDARAVAMSTLVRGLAVAVLVINHGMRSEVVHPGLAKFVVQFGDAVLRYDGHLPLDPVGRIDRRWWRALAASTAGAATVVVWCSVAGIVGSRQVVDAAMICVIASAATALVPFVRCAIGARSGGVGQRSSVGVLLTFGLYAAVWLAISDGTDVSGRSWVLPLAALVVVATAGSWAWARHRWST